MMRSVISGLLLMFPRIQKKVNESQLSKRHLSQMNRNISHRRAGLVNCECWTQRGFLALSAKKMKYDVQLIFIFVYAMIIATINI